MTNATMKAGTITAKLRDAVPVRFMESNSEAIRYKNIDIPDALTELEITGFEFDVPADGKITFQLFFAPGILPTEFPPAREKMTRAEKAAAKTETVNTEELVAAAAEVITATGGSDVTVTPTDADESADAPEIPAIPEYRFNVTGDRRKALVTAVKDFTGTDPVYKGAPGYAYAVGSYIIDRTGTLIGEATPELLAALAEQGFTPEAA